MVGGVERTTGNNAHHSWVLVSGSVMMLCVDFWLYENWLEDSIYLGRGGWDHGLRQHCLEVTLIFFDTELRVFLHQFVLKKIES
jgi:hypothetical protein